jgi:hypothetical protein
MNKSTQTLLLKMYVISLLRQYLGQLIDSVNRKSISWQKSYANTL